MDLQVQCAFHARRLQTHRPLDLKNGEHEGTKRPLTGLVARAGPTNERCADFMRTIFLTLVRSRSWQNAEGARRGQFKQPGLREAITPIVPVAWTASAEVRTGNLTARRLGFTQTTT